MKQNSCLTYENFCLQLELDTLNYKYDQFRMEQMKTETNYRLKYIHHNKPDDSIIKKPNNIGHDHEIPEKLEVSRHDRPSCSKSHSVQSEKVQRKSILPTCSKHQSYTDESIVKIYERKKYPDVPKIKLVDEKEQKEKITKRSRDVKKRQSETKVESKASSGFKMERKPNNELPEHLCFQEVRKKNSARLALFQVSDVQSAVSSDLISLPHMFRSRSSPDLQGRTNTSQKYFL